MDKKVYNYITESRTKGLSDEEVSNNLIKSGWDRELVKTMLEEASIPQAPTELPRVDGTRVNSEEITSPYSTFVGVLLAISLFILSTGLINDIQETINGLNKVLIYEGIFTMLLLFAGIILYTSFEEKKRFLVISIPYFVVSGWFFCRLLIRVAGYILDKNAALGVYIVLGMVIAVLTVIIIVAQKVIHK